MLIKLKTATAIIAAGAVALSGVNAQSVEIKTAPGDYVFVNNARPNKNYRDVMVQTILVCNRGDTPVTLNALQIDVFGDGVVTKSAPIGQLINQSRQYAGMAAQGMGVFFKAELLSEEGLSAHCGPGATLASSETMAPGEALVSRSHYFATDFAPTEILITASLSGSQGEHITVRRALAAKKREQPFDYASPLKGGWLMRAFPNVASHHRYIPSNEFALDFFKTGADGAMDQGGKNTAEDDYGFNEPVFAVADGEVVFVIDGEVQDPSALSRRDGESVEDARQRITQYQMQRFADNFRAAAAGNMITIKHEMNGHIEYSSYAHLKPDSISVKPGDRVQRGEQIAAVGNTGDSTLTHLHFQLNSGPDAFHSRSLPVSFSNGRSRFIGQDPGLFMLFEE